MINYRIIRSNRKTLALQITDEGVLVRAPMHLPDGQIRRFVEEKSGWIEARLEKRSAWQQQPPYTQEQIRQLANLAGEQLSAQAAYYAKQLGVSYNRITIRSQRTRWGSCSGRKNLNFNCLLMLAPPQVQDYVVVHELCHLLEMNHSPRFWALVEGILPDYRTHRRWLRENGTGLISRLPK